MAHDEVVRAASNNAVWCDAICRTHGRPGTWAPGAWINPRPVPRFHPNVVTLAADGRPRDHVLDLLGAALPGSWSVKDSFDALDLLPLGFRTLFDASWVRWAPSRSHAPSSGRWRRVTEPEALSAWEAAWTDDATAPRVFLPALLRDPEVAVLAVEIDDRVVAGGIANRAAGVVGLTNVFDRRADASAWEACARAASSIFGELPVVAWAMGDDLARARAAAFEPTAPLRIWIRAAD